MTDSARDVSVKFATKFLLEQWERGEPLNPQAAHDLGCEWLTALRTAGFAPPIKKDALLDALYEMWLSGDANDGRGNRRTGLHEAESMLDILLKAAQGGTDE